MAIGLVGKKRGMTRIFTESGESIAVTVIDVDDNRVVQVKTPETDGYSAVQVTRGVVKPNRLNKPSLGVYKKATVEPGEGLWEFRLDSSEKYEVGQTVALELFKKGQLIDVTGISKGKGFAGVVKRWKFKTQDATHGNSLAHRAPGSIGQNQTPGRVFKGKKMAGQLGNKKVTLQKSRIVGVDVDRRLLLVKGAVPGAIGGCVIIRPSIKAA